MEGGGGRVSLGDVAQQVLGLPLAGEGAPILAKRKSIERKVDEAKREERDSHALSRAKRSLAVQAHRKLRGAKAGESDGVLEAELRKIATGGVIQLFNSVRAQQREPAEPSKQKKRAERRRATAATLPENSGSRPGAPLDMSKESFLDILRRGSAAGAASGAAAGARAPFLQDDFGLAKRKAKAKHWDNPAEDEEDEEDAEGGGGEAPDDFDDEGDEADDESDDDAP